MKRLLILLTAITAMIASCTTTNPDKEAAEKLDAVLSAMFPSDEPGAAALVLKGDEIVFDKGYGIADINTKAPIDGNTSFNIASVSKQFTSTAILILAERGELSLEDPVSKYFPEYKGEFWKDIQIKHLLSHCSGVPDARRNIPYEVKLKGDDALAMAYLTDLDHVNFQPGEAYEYINPTFVLCGAIVEKVSGVPFAEFVTDNIFLPSGMNKTMYFEPAKESLIPNMAHGYEYEDTSNMPEERTATAQPVEGPKDWFELDYGEETFFATKPDGGIYTSTHQFVNWEKALRANKIISEESRKDAQSPHTLVSGSEWSDYQNRPNTWYGYGWFIEPKTDSTAEVIYHTGDNGGFKILAARYPESNALVLVFANRADWDRYELMQKIEEIYGL